MIFLLFKAIYESGSMKGLSVSAVADRLSSQRTFYERMNS
jgi:hypothetical protein